MEFIERLPGTDDERWLVRDGGEERVAWFLYNGHGDDWLEQVATGTQRWVGFSHPRINRLHSVGKLRNRVVLVVDDDRGPSLARAAAELADPAERERWVIAQIITIADGLAAMAKWSPGFVHRRLEPDQMFIDLAGHARLRAPVETVTVGPRRNYTGAATVMGDPRWMSPEQARGLDVTPATDVFALASNLAYALTGQPPFDSENMMQIVVDVLTVEPAPVQTFAPGLDHVLARAFAKPTDQRYPDVAAFATELYNCIPDAGDYDAVTSDRIAAWWPTAPQAHGTTHEIAGQRCHRTWESLTPVTDDVRHCDGCNQPVVLATSPRAVLPLLGNSCMAYREGAR